MTTRLFLCSSLGFLFTLFASPTWAGITTLEGTAEGLPYQVQLSDEWQGVQGSWGDSRSFDLDWDPYYVSVSGTTDGSAQSAEFDPEVRQVHATLPCGWIDFQYDSAKKPTLTGTYCTRNTRMTFESQDEMMSWIKHTVLTELVADFPPPTQAPVTEFFLKLVRF